MGRLEQTRLETHFRHIHPLPLDSPQSLLHGRQFPFACVASLGSCQPGSGGWAPGTETRLKTKLKCFPPPVAFPCCLNGRVERVHGNVDFTYHGVVHPPRGLFSVSFGPAKVPWFPVPAFEAEIRLCWLSRRRRYLLLCRGVKPVLNWANVCSPNILRTLRRITIRFLIELLIIRIWFGQSKLYFILNWLVMRCKLRPELAADAQQTAWSKK